jgi:hypothetical protein
MTGPSAPLPWEFGRSATDLSFHFTGFSWISVLLSAPTKAEALAPLLPTLAATIFTGDCFVLNG